MSTRRRRIRISDALLALLRRLHPHVRRKVRAALDDISCRPASGKALKRDLQGLWSYRVGRIRLIYRPIDASTIDLIAVGPRRTIYEETVRLMRH